MKRYKLQISVPGVSNRHNSRTRDFTNLSERAVLVFGAKQLLLGNTVTITNEGSGKRDTYKKVKTLWERKLP